MTTKAIEAGARAICRIFCSVHKQPEWGKLTAAQQELEVDLQAELWIAESKACIEAAIASGELVPASAVVAERERCAKVAERAAERDAAWAVKYPDEARRCEERELRATTIAAAIRALEPASGEFVLVPREPTKEMVNAGCDARVDGWEDSYYDDEERQEIVEWVKEGYRAMLTAATSNGSGK